MSLNRDLEANGSEGYVEKRVPSKSPVADSSVSICFFRAVPKESLLDFDQEKGIEYTVSDADKFKCLLSETIQCAVS